MPLQLRQGQVWRKGDELIRIVRLERLEVGYKMGLNLASGEGTHHQASKKDFCRLIKSATLLPPGQPAKPSPPSAPPPPPTAN